MSETRQYCTFFLGDCYFGFAVEHVQEVLKYQDVTEVPLAPPVVRGNFSSSDLTIEWSWPRFTPIFSKTGPTIPSCSSSKPASKCSASI